MEISTVRAISFIVALAAAGGAHACGTQVTGGDSESHFLAFCGGRCGGGLQCTCGVCTRACDDTNACGALSRHAECAAPSDSSCEIKVCDVACIEDEGCKSVGPAHVCIQGRCRDILASARAGAGGASGAGATGDFSSERAGGASIISPGAAGSASSVERPDAGPCGSSKTYPSRPAPGGGADSIEIVVVQGDVDFGDSPPSTTESPTRFRNIGFDLDGACETKCAVSLGSNVVDGPGAIDNAFGQVVQSIRNLLTNFSSDIYSEQIRRGAKSLLIHVVEYNGAADDDQVGVELMYAAPYNAFSSTAILPGFDGTDIFPVAGGSVLDNDLRKPRIVDPSAYVTNGKLVAALGDMTFPYFFGFTNTYDTRVDVPLHAAFLTCDVTSTDVGHWGFTLRNCTLAGRLIADDLVHQLWHLPDPLDEQNPKPLCTNSTSYPGFKRTICDLVDIESTETVAGPVGPCDALSVGLSFNMVPASLGDVFNDTPVSPECAVGTDPQNDSCDAQ